MINSKLISEKFNLTHKGKEQVVSGFGSLKNQNDGILLFCKSSNNLKNLQKGIVILNEDLDVSPYPDITFLLTSKSPRLLFAKILNTYFSDKLSNDFENHVEDHKRNSKVKIGENCFIGANVTIGNGTEILHNTSIFSNTRIGENCQINTSCSIGTAGLGFEYDEEEIVKFPQFGGVLIESGVEIGPNSTIRRGALDDTIIGENCKIGSLTNVGHNCIVGKQTILACQVALGGSTIIGSRVFMGINSSTKSKISIGSKTTVGMGGVVTKDLPSNVIAAGIPAEIIKENE